LILDQGIDGVMGEKHAIVMASFTAAALAAAFAINLLIHRRTRKRLGTKSIQFLSWISFGLLHSFDVLESYQAIRDPFFPSYMSSIWD
jgi:hypothetical protein